MSRRSQTDCADRRGGAGLHQLPLSLPPPPSPCLLASRQPITAPSPWDPYPGRTGTHWPRTWEFRLGQRMLWARAVSRHLVGGS